MQKAGQMDEAGPGLLNRLSDAFFVLSVASHQNWGRPEGESGEVVGSRNQGGVGLNRVKMKKEKKYCRTQ